MRIHDLVGIGLGPFNLGLACLVEPIGELDAVFLEAHDHFSWHPGMLLDDATLQVPFLADLVTLADPTSAYSFLAFLKDTGRLYPFYIRESFYPLRREYDAYCRWASERLTSVRFGQRVERVEHDGSAYVVTTAGGERFRTRRLVLGTGTTPRLPAAAAGLPAERTLHTADYLHRRDELTRSDAVTVVGSGQSAAEVFADLLDATDDVDLTWVTRSPRFFPMEYTKLTLELTSPEYTAYFQALPDAVREPLLREQRTLYKGISGDLVDRIYDALYAREVRGTSPGRVTLLSASELVAARWTGSEVSLELRHVELGETFRVPTSHLVLATGYAGGVPGFLDPVRDRLRLDERGRYAASATYDVGRTPGELFVLNGEEHTHGLVAPDLGMGAYRNSVVIAAILGREVYPVEKRIAFQEFGVPDRYRISS